MGSSHQGGHVDDERCEFQVIGELKDDPGHLLVMDRDGHFYDYDVELGEIIHVVVDDRWFVDVLDNAAGRIALPKMRAAS